ncbi:sulfotransferase domain protein [Teladorsagia circumcincta]|uniref:Sulfotransferase domain protein n=1 Tax=Teladorsagia circumcincta TaxID=45464 RepID=A0A2G9TNQ8_TELCI|nr:sulfotransferase domain protein [Teladorsagia circumcincta]
MHPNVSTNEPIPESFEELQFFGGANYHRGIEWYSKRFTAAHVVFDKSATYFDNPSAAKQAFALVPNAKIVVILYDPTRRAYSCYTHHLDRWLELYPLSNLILIDGERLREEPATVLLELAENLGLPDFDFKNRIRFSASKGFFCQVSKEKTKCLGRGKGRAYPPMSPELWSRLNNIFLPDNTALHKFLVKKSLTCAKMVTSAVRRMTNNRPINMCREVLMAVAC